LPFLIGFAIVDAMDICHENDSGQGVIRVYAARVKVVAAGLLPMESKFQRLGGIAIHLLDDCVIALNEH